MYSIVNEILISCQKDINDIVSEFSSIKGDVSSLVSIEDMVELQVLLHSIKSGLGLE